MGVRRPKRNPPVDGCCAEILASATALRGSEDHRDSEYEAVISDQRRRRRQWIRPLQHVERPLIEGRIPGSFHTPARNEMAFPIQLEADDDLDFGRWMIDP